MLNLMPAEPLTPSQRYEAARKLRKKGLSKVKIGRELGMCASAVARLLRNRPADEKRVIIMVNGKRTSVTEAQRDARDERVAQLRDDGISNREIEKIIGIGANGVANIISRLLKSGRIKRQPNFDIKAACKAYRDEKAEQAKRIQAIEAMRAKEQLRKSRDPWPEERDALMRQLFYKKRWGLSSIAEHLTRADPMLPEVTAPQVRARLYGERL